MAALFRFAGLGLLGLLVWYAVSKWMQYVFINEVFVSAVSNYQSQYTNWPIVLGTADVVMQARIILHYVLVVPIRHLLDVKECASSWVYTATLVPLASLLVISWRTMKWQQAFLVCILLTAVMYLPYVMDVLLLYYMPERVHVAAPLSRFLLLLPHWRSSANSRLFRFRRGHRYSSASGSKYGCRPILRNKIP